MLERIQAPPPEQTEKLTLTRLALWCKTQVWPEAKPILTDPKQKGALELTTSVLQKLSQKPEWQRENCKKKKNWIYLLINSVQFLHLPSIGLSVVIHIQNYHCLHITNMYLEWNSMYLQAMILTAYELLPQKHWAHFHCLPSLYSFTAK